MQLGYGKPKSKYFRGVAQMVARQFRVLEAWSSNLHTSTKKEKRQPLRLSFFFFVDAYDANYTRVKREWSSHSKGSRGSLLTKASERNIAARLYLHTSTKKTVFDGLFLLSYAFCICFCLPLKFYFLKKMNQKLFNLN